MLYLFCKFNLIKMLHSLVFCAFVVGACCRSERDVHDANPKDEILNSHKAGFVEKDTNKKITPKNRLTAKLMSSVDKAIAENFEDNVVTSWMRSDEGHQTVTKAADMLTDYLSRSFGLAEEDIEEDEYTMKNLIGDFLKSQKKNDKSKKVESLRKKGEEASSVI